MRNYHNQGMTMAESVAAEPAKGFTLVARFAEQGVKIERRTRTGKLRVTYGLQVADELTYEQACGSLGECLMHAFACDGLLD